jgi:hypothetical protein
MWTLQHKVFWVGINISRICSKKEEEGIRLQIFRFFGGWVWGEG